MNTGSRNDQSTALWFRAPAIVGQVASYVSARRPFVFVGSFCGQGRCSRVSLLHGVRSSSWSLDRPSGRASHAQELRRSVAGTSHRPCSANEGALRIPTAPAHLSRAGRRETRGASANQDQGVAFGTLGEAPIHRFEGLSALVVNHAHGGYRWTHHLFAVQGRGCWD